MEWVSGWIQGIIIAVIISTIIEMILPEGSSKKYIKVVIGVYILFSIVSPVISKVTGNNLQLSDIFDLDEYIETSKNSGSLQNQLEGQNQNQIKEIYLSSMKNDIQEKIRNRGYQVNQIEIEVENDEQYSLKQIKLQIEKKTKSEEEKSNQTIETINKVEIGVGQVKNENTTSSKKATTSQSKKQIISSQEKRDLKQYLSGVYEISTQNIFINE